MSVNNKASSANVRPTLMWRLFKYSAIFLALMAVLFIIALKLIERSPAQLKIGFESYLTQLWGYPTDIQTLNQITFFPHMRIDVSGVRAWPIDDPQGSVISAERVLVDMPLWSVVLGRPRFSDLLLSGIMISNDVTGMGEISIASIAPDEMSDVLRLEASIDGVASDISVPLNKSANGIYAIPSPPLRVTGTLEKGKSAGDFFIDLNRDQYGATATFSTYRAQDMRPVQRLLEQRFSAQADKTVLPVQVHIEHLIDKTGGQSGPYIIPALRMENGHLQPMECFYNNQDRTRADVHPCARYFKEPEFSEAP